MLKNAFYVALFTLISWGSYQLSYPSNTPIDLYYDGMFFENLIKHVDHLTRGPRAVGEYYHADAQRYIIKQLQDMGLTVSRHRSTSFNPRNKMAAPVSNIIATIPGTAPDGKDLLLMAHYDAAKFSGTGAADDASGVAIILEAVNAFLKTVKTSKNNIILLFSDAEELGLLGAQAFIYEKLKNHDVGLIINLEARGSSGPSMMWPETVGGNQAMIEAFQAADVPMPVTTSLHYEIYRMLPNDTDLTPFNQMAQINGFNFAFIDDHFNYHTRLDNLERISLDTLAHQTIQFHSLLKYFSQNDIDNLQADDSLVYFSIPMVGLLSYPTAINLVLLGLIGLALIYALVTSFSTGKSSVKALLHGFIPLFMAGLLSFGLAWSVLFLIHTLYPETLDVIQGFPYQGHAMMIGLLVSSALITTVSYGVVNKSDRLNQLLLNLLLWFLILLPLVYYLPGAGMLVWPVLLSTIVLLLQLHQPKIAEHIAPIVAAISFVILGMLLINLPIALGVGILPLTTVILVFMLALFVPFISPVKNVWTGLLLLLIPLGYVTYALVHQPTISENQPHPTSLSYLYDFDEQQGYFYNYDRTFSGWNDELFIHVEPIEAMNQFRRNYKKPVRHLTKSSDHETLSPIEVKVTKPLKQGDKLSLKINLQAHHNSEILEIFTKQPLTLYKLGIEGRQAVLAEPLVLDSGDRLLQYYFDGKKGIELIIEVDPESTLDWQIQTHSTDLLQHTAFDIQRRPAHQIQKPFTKSDNITLVQSMTFGFDQ